MYLPRREDLRAHIFARADAAGCIGDQVSWPIDVLVPDDVYVADVMGRLEGGAAIGDGLYEAELRYLVDQEWARSAEDVLWRRSKLGLHVSEQTSGRLEDWLAHHATGDEPRSVAAD